MIIFFMLAALLALSTFWLLVMPLLGSDAPKKEKRLAALYALLATLVFPFTVYYFVTF